MTPRASKYCTVWRKLNEKCLPFLEAPGVRTSFLQLASSPPRSSCETAEEAQPGKEYHRGAPANVIGRTQRSGGFKPEQQPSRGTPAPYPMGKPLQPSALAPGAQQGSAVNF